MKKNILVTMTFLCLSFGQVKSQPPLHKAIILHDLKTAKKLIDEGCNVNEHSKSCFPLMIAVGHKDQDMVELLLKNGAKADTCIAGHSNLYFEGEFELSNKNQILYNPFYYAIKLNQFGIVKLFYDYRYDITKAMGGTQFTYPIIAASKFARTDILDFLLEKGVDVTVKDDEGKNAIMYTAPANNLEITYLLLQKGCRVNDTSNIGYTTLMYAVKAKGITKEMVNLLITKGADINHFNQNNESALSLACSCNNRSLALFLLEHGATGKDSNTEIESNARMNHFFGDYFLSKGNINNCKGFYLIAKQYYNDCIPPIKEKLSDIKRQKKIDKVLEAIPYVVAGAVGRTDAVIQDMLTNRQYSAINTTIIYDEQPPVNASLDEFAIYYKNRITQFESSVALIDGIMACIEKGFTDQELISCIKTIQLPNNK